MAEVTPIDDPDGQPHAELFERREPRAVRLTLAAGEEVPEHTHPGTNVVLHLLEGRLELTLDGEPYALSPGELVRFSGERAVSPRAIEPSTAVVVFAPVE